jgi:hypothetical protein
MMTGAAVAVLAALRSGRVDDVFFGVQVGRGPSSRQPVPLSPATSSAGPRSRVMASSSRCRRPGARPAGRRR